MQENQGIRPDQYGFKKRRFCLTNLMFYGKVTHLDEGKAVDGVCLGFRKEFDAISHSILLGNVAAHALDKKFIHSCVDKKLAGCLNPGSAVEWS